VIGESVPGSSATSSVVSNTSSSPSTSTVPDSPVKRNKLSDPYGKIFKPLSDESRNGNSSRGLSDSSHRIPVVPSQPIQRVHSQEALLEHE